MGSGVMPLAMATRPSKAARDPAIPGVSPGERLVERGPGHGSGAQPSRSGRREASCVVSSEERLAALAFGEALLRLSPRRNQGSAGDGPRLEFTPEVIRGTGASFGWPCPGEFPGARSLAVLAAGRGVGSRSSD